MLRHWNWYTRSLGTDKRYGSYLCAEHGLIVTRKQQASRVNASQGVPSSHTDVAAPQPRRAFPVVAAQDPASSTHAPGTMSVVSQPADGRDPSHGPDRHAPSRDARAEPYKRPVSVFI